MKAAVYEKGSADVLVLREIQKPVARENEVLVKIHMASVNALDYRSIKMGITKNNTIMGADVAGRVESVGENVRSFRAGDDVVGDLSGCGMGGFAQYAAVPETALVQKPAEICFEDAAAVPVAAITALQALRDKGQVSPGQNVLIVGAGGGVGTYAVQLAKHFGARVTAVCGPKNVDMIKSIGADIVIDYTKVRFDTRKEQYDLVVAANGSNLLSAYKRVLKSKGICVVLGGALRQIFSTMVFGPFLSIGGKKIRMLAAKPSQDDLSLILGLVSEGRIKPVIDRRYPLSEAAKALKYLSAGHARGKVVINISEENEYESC